MHYLITGLLNREAIDWLEQRTVVLSPELIPEKGIVTYLILYNGC